jgi:hypothetical protein
MVASTSGTVTLGEMNAADESAAGSARPRNGLSCACLTAIVCFGPPLLGFTIYCALVLLYPPHEHYPIRISALSSAKGLIIAAQMYVADSDDRLPRASNWMDELMPYVHDPMAFRSSAVRTPNDAGTAQQSDALQLYGSHLGDEVPPSIDAVNRIAKLERDAGAYGFAFRRRLSGHKLGSFGEPERVALIFDSSDTHWNANGGLDLLPNPGRYPGPGSARVNAIAFVDGHVKLLRFGDPSIK